MNSGLLNSGHIHVNFCDLVWTRTTSILSPSCSYVVLNLKIDILALVYGRGSTKNTEMASLRLLSASYYDRSRASWYAPPIAERGLYSTVTTTVLGRSRARLRWRRRHGARWPSVSGMVYCRRGWAEFRVIGVSVFDITCKIILY